MVSSKIIVLAIVVVTCIAQAQSASRIHRQAAGGDKIEDDAESGAGGAGGAGGEGGAGGAGGAGGIESIYNNFGQIFTKAPNDIIVIFKNFFKSAGSKTKQ